MITLVESYLHIPVSSSALSQSPKEGARDLRSFQSPVSAKSEEKVYKRVQLRETEDTVPALMLPEPFHSRKKMSPAL